MKKLLSRTLLALTVMLFTAFTVSAQSPVKWSATSKMLNRTEGVITITATIDAGWHMYGFTQPEDGPNATKIDFTGTKGVTFKGSVKASPTPKSVYEEMFGAKVSYWEKKVVFTRKFKVSGAKTASATITVNYMVCNDTSCRPPCTETLKVKLK